MLCTRSWFADAFVFEQLLHRDGLISDLEHAGAAQKQRQPPRFGLSNTAPALTTAGSADGARRCECIPSLVRVCVRALGLCARSCVRAFVRARVRARVGSHARLCVGSHARLCVVLLRARVCARQGLVCSARPAPGRAGSRERHAKALVLSVCARTACPGRPWWPRLALSVSSAPASPAPRRLLALATRTRRTTPAGSGPVRLRAAGLRPPSC